VSQNSAGTTAFINISGDDGTNDGGAGVNFRYNETVKWSLFTRRYSSANKLYISTGEGDANSSKVTITEGGNVGIGTTSPSRLLHLSSASDAYIQVNRGSITSLFGTDNVGTYIGQQGAYDLRLVTNATERARIDSSGRLLVGTSSASYSTTVKLQGNSASSTGESRIRLCRGTASPANGDTLAILGFSDNTETPSAEIAAQRDGGTWSASSVPGRLVFSTTADGASSPTERMRLDSSGDVRLSLGSSQSRTLSFHNTTSNITYATINYEDVSGRLTLSDSYGIAFNTVAGGGAASNATEAARIDNSGRLLVGTSSR
jgi:hypothetical protein